jgi:hypothetical protein
VKKLQKMTAQITDRLSLNSLFEKMYTTRERRPPLKALILLTDVEPEDFKNLILKRKKLSKIFNIRIEKLENNLYSLKVNRFHFQKNISGNAVIDSGRKGVWVVYSNERLHFIKLGLESLFAKLYPDFSRLYINYYQIRGLLDNTKKAYSGQTIMTNFIVRREPKFTDTGLKGGTFQLWEEDADAELQRQSKNFRLTIHIVNFEVRDRDGSILLQGQVSRRGVCKLRFGSFSMFQNNVVHQAIDLSLKWRGFYAHRERVTKENGEILLRPFRISYSSDFDTKQLFRLTEKISKNYMCSIIHAGNPYFAANVCDSIDGSSFGVTALGSKVTVTPITKGSHQAAWRLTNRLQEILGDGEVLNVMG